MYTINTSMDYRSLKDHSSIGSGSFGIILPLYGDAKKFCFKTLADRNLAVDIFKDPTNKLAILNIQHEDKIIQEVCKIKLLEKNDVNYEKDDATKELVQEYVKYKEKENNLSRTFLPNPKKLFDDIK